LGWSDLKKWPVKQKPKYSDSIGGTIMERGFPVSECVSNPEMTFITAAVYTDVPFTSGV